MKLFTRPVFEYLDYRAYLSDFYAHHKKHEYGFSHRVFARRAGCQSTNHPCLVIKGRRNLSADMAQRFAEACALKGHAAAYFVDLVEFNQAKTQREKERAYARLAQFSRFRQVNKLTEAQAAYFSEWYIPATRELAARPDFLADARWVSRQLQPEITVPQANRALKTLINLGFLEMGPAQTVTRREQLLTSGGPLGHQLVSYHQAMLVRAGEAIELIPREQREIASLTLCVSESRLQELKQRIQAFRKELLQSAEEEDTPERVVQLNFQLFPLSKSPSR